VSHFGARWRASAHRYDGNEEAFARLRGHAYAQGRRLTDVARDIVARRLRLDSGPNPRQDYEN